MFTLVQIQTAHSKVKSGADFPAYIREIRQLGVISYETFVADGHVDYLGESNFRVSSQPKYEKLEISAEANINEFIKNLKEHQQGKTDYATFCEACAKIGIEKWAVSIENMTCIYYDAAGKEVLRENIPG
jgi:uncharacterized protein YbcV (DUF1398 family)